MNITNKHNKLLKRFGSLNLSVLPTVTQRLENLSKHLGANLYCKRDDLTGFAFGGNKTRKLDYLLADAVKMGADCIVTFGSNQSNWCRMSSAAAAYMGMDSYLLLDGSRPRIPSGNLLLDQLVGAGIEYTNEQDPDKLVRMALSKVDKLRGEGRRPYYLPVGGSVPIGSLGYIKAFSEILDYSDEKGRDFDMILVATGSAGTQAGLVCGALLEEWKGQIIGVSVGRERQEQETMVRELVKETFEMLGMDIRSDDIAGKTKVDDEYIGGGYRHNTDAAAEAIEMFARLEGIFLDEVYTGKAAAALIDYARKGSFGSRQNILFVHTGGGIQLFE